MQSNGEGNSRFWPPSDSTLGYEIWVMSQPNDMGRVSRVTWTELIKADKKAFWQDLPAWFRRQARPLLDPKYKPPKPKPKNVISNQVMEAIESFYQEGQHAMPK